MTITSPVEPKACKAIPWYVIILVLDAHYISFKAHPNTIKQAKFIDIIPTNHPPLENYKGKYNIFITQYPLQTAIKLCSSVILGNE